MIKVLIVDDEILIRVGIKMCVDWEANGFEIIGLAEDGIQALEIISKRKPEIVLTDIKMPNMDGLELIERIKKQYAQIRIIVLSCHNEFDFVKRAMKLGANDYILKLSMQPDDLLNVLMDLKDSIIKEKKMLIQPDDGSREINKGFLKKDLYKMAIDDTISGDYLTNELKKLGCEISFYSTSIICASIDDFSNASVRSRLEGKYLLKFSVVNIIDEILNNYYKGDISEIGDGEFIIVFDYHGEIDEYNKKLEEFFNSINNALENYLNITISFGVSELWNIPNDFKVRYSQAARALEQRFYNGRGSIIFYNKKMDFLDKLVLLNFDKEKLLIGYLENLDEEGAKEIIESFFNNIQSKKEYHPSRVRMAAVEIFHSFVKVAKKFEIETDFELMISQGCKNPIDSCKNPIDILMKAETALTISNWFQEIVEKFIICLSNKRLSIERPEIIKLKKYILDKIYEDVTLEKVAKIINMNKSYLSSLFKKETGESFTDYVNRLKMQEAKELIQRYGFKTYEAAEKMGYSDESYFSKLFKKYIGVNPSKVGRFER